MAINSRHPGDQATNFEDRVNIISLIARKETPFLSRAGKTKADAQTHNWQLDTYDTPSATNTKISGATVSTAASDAKIRTTAFNYTQNPYKPFGTNKAQEYTRKPQLGRGTGSEFDYQRQKKTVELARDVEMALLSNIDRTQPTSSVAGQMRGVQNWITTNAINASLNNKPQPLARAHFESAMAKAWTQGGNPGIVFANISQKLAFAHLVTPTGRTIDETGKKIVEVVNQFETVGGMTDIVLDPRMGQDAILILDMNFWFTAWLFGYEFERLGEDGSGPRGYVEAELTVEARNEAASSKVTGLVYVDYGTAA